MSRRDYYTSHNNELVSTHHHPKSTAYSKTFSSFLDFNTCTLLHVCHYTIMERDFIALKVPCAVILYPFLHADLWELPVFSYFHHFAFHTRSWITLIQRWIFCVVSFSSGWGVVTFPPCLFVTWGLICFYCSIVICWDILQFIYWFTEEHLSWFHVWAIIVKLP